MMISTIMLIVTLMVEIAAEPMSIQTFAQNAYVLKGEEKALLVQVVEQPLQLVESVIRAG